jgi:hypothetical protein
MGTNCGGQVWNDCGTSCPEMCGTPPPMMCNMMCNAAWQCPGGTCWDAAVGACSTAFAVDAGFACDVDRIAADCNGAMDPASFCSSVCYRTSAAMEPACTAEGAAFALGLRQMVASCKH